jgi:hypothetical protein
LDNEQGMTSLFLVRYSLFVEKKLAVAGASPAIQQPINNLSMPKRFQFNQSPTVL